MWEVKAAVSRFMRPLLAGTLAVFVGLLLVLSLQARKEMATFQETPVDNIYWNVTQLELDMFRLESEAVLTQNLPDRDLTELRKRFDLFYSRAAYLVVGSTFENLNMSNLVDPVAAKLNDFIARRTPLIDGDDAGLRAALPEMSVEVRQLRQDFRATVVKIVSDLAAKSDAQRTGFAQLLQRIAYASLGFFVLLAVLLAYVLQLYAQTQRKSAEVALVTSRLEATVGTALDGVIVMGPDGRIIDYNRSAEQIFGFARAEAIGSHLEDLIIPERYVASHHARMARLAEEGGKKVVEAGRMQITARRKSGEEFEAEMSIASDSDKDGIMVIAFMRDISQRLADENALRFARDNALQAERAKSNFIAVMSHEMRTPLNGVMASLEIAKRKTVDDHQGRFLDLAESAAKQLLRHVNDVLDISKVETGHLPLSEDVFDLPDLVETLVEPMQTKATQSGNRVDIRTFGEMPTFRGDSFRLGQVIQNLMSNAIKFTAGGTISVELETQPGTDGQMTVEIRVTDTGIGISEEDQSRVFEDFVMIDPSYGRASGGTGLGLAISRRLVEAMGGEIGVESDLGQGSCFWFRVPLAISDAHLADTVPPVTDFVAYLHGLDVLVVEDNVTNQLVLQEMLIQLGHNVTLANDGAEGVRHARAKRFDVILMDISMPVMDGITATRLIRTDGMSQHSRIIAVTAHSLPSELAKFEAATMEACLTKPINSAELRRVLAKSPVVAEVKATASDTLINHDRLAEVRAAMGETGMVRLVKRYLADMDRIFLALGQMSQADHADEMTKLIHEGAGASATLGATVLHRHLSAAETLSKSANTSTLGARLTECADIYKQTATELRQLFEDRPLQIAKAV